MNYWHLTAFSLKPYHLQMFVMMLMLYARQVHHIITDPRIHIQHKTTNWKSILSARLKTLLMNKLQILQRLQRTSRNCGATPVQFLVISEPNSKCINVFMRILSFELLLFMRGSSQLSGETSQVSLVSPTVGRWKEAVIWYKLQPR